VVEPLQWDLSLSLTAPSPANDTCGRPLSPAFNDNQLPALAARSAVLACCS